RIFQIPHIDGSYRQREAVGETAFGDSANQRIGAPLEDRERFIAGSSRLAFATTTGRLALPRTDTAADTRQLSPLLNALIGIVQHHDKETPRNRSTSCLVRNCFNASNVAFTSKTGFGLPRLFVNMFVIPQASHTLRTAAPAITPVPGPA